MWTGFTNRGVLLHLPGEGSAQVHGATARLVRLPPEHAGGGEFVVGAASAGLLLHLDHVDGVPAALDLLRLSVPSLLYQYDT